MGLHVNLAQYHLLSGHKDSCRYYLNLGYDLFPLIQEKQDKIFFLFEAAKAFQLMGDYKQAYTFYRDGAELRQTMARSHGLAPIIHCGLFEKWMVKLTSSKPKPINSLLASLR